MTKAELVKAIAEKADMPSTKVDAIFNALVDTIAETLGKGEEVKIAGFANFEVNERAARVGRNPKTGEALQIAACMRVKITAGSKLKAAVA